MRDRLIELISKFKRVCNQSCDGLAKSCTRCMEEQLADYILADGWIRPPCKVGQTVYSQKGCFFLPYEKDINPKEVIPCEVIAIKQTRWGKYILLKPLLIETYGMRSSNEWFTFSAIEKTVFLTKEEAEQALKGGVQE